MILKIMLVSQLFTMFISNLKTKYNLDKIVMKIKIHHYNHILTELNQRIHW